MRKLSDTLPQSPCRTSSACIKASGHDRDCYDRGRSSRRLRAGRRVDPNQSSSSGPLTPTPSGRRKAKFKAVVEDIVDAHEAGPVLVGTRFRSLDIGDADRIGVPYEVLNASSMPGSRTSPRLAGKAL